MLDPETLTDRQRELVIATVAAWRAGSNEPLRLVADHDFAIHPDWPDEIDPPNADELHALVHTDWLTADRSAAPDWTLPGVSAST